MMLLLKAGSGGDVDFMCCCPETRKLAPTLLPENVAALNAAKT